MLINIGLSVTDNAVELHPINPPPSLVAISIQEMIVGVMVGVTVLVGVTVFVGVIVGVLVGVVVLVGVTLLVTVGVGVGNGFGVNGS